MRDWDDGQLPQMAKHSGGSMDRLLAAYRPMVLGMVIRHMHTVRDEYVQAGVEAVMEAARAYDPDKGHFGALAKRVVSRRLIDVKRRERRSREVMLGDLGDEHRENVMAEASRQVHLMKEAAENRRDEIAEYGKALEKLEISLEDLVRASPKHEKTRALCRDAARYLYTHSDLCESVLAGRLPISRLCDAFQTSDKVWERHRRYLIACVVALSGDYPHIRSRIVGREEWR